MMRLYSYVVKHDTGFSPNPFWGYCTLANCKPAIRRTARLGDWIVGIGPKARGNRLVYAMRVDEILSYAQYYSDPRFQMKIPDYAKGDVIYKCGDNIYKPLTNGGYLQLHSAHSHDEEEDARSKEHDLKGQNVLVSRMFFYYGRQSIELPLELRQLKVARGHKNRFCPTVVEAFHKFITGRAPGVHAPPTQWPSDDTSWRTSAQ